MNDLIDKDSFAKATNLDKFRLAGLSKFLMGALKIDKINNLYQKNSNKSSIEFIDAVLAELQIDFTLNNDDLKNIPKTGPAIVVANHPLGGIDGLLLIKLISEVRSDVKVMANFLLSSVAPINDYLISVNPFENTKELKSSFRGLKSAHEHLDSGGLLCVFPAGEVSSYNLRSKSIRDREWQPSALKFIKAKQVPVVPVNFTGNNSLMFHLLGMINPMLRTAKLPSELFNKKDKNITVRIGRPIPPKEQDEFEDVFEYGRYLRTRTYLLGKPISVKPFFRPALFKKKSREIVDAQDLDSIEKEVNSLRETGYLLYENKEFQVFWAGSEQAPAILYEIGRLREITFRAVGEGTGKNIDLDEYDLYYRHLFIWDAVEKKIVGAYRLGMGKEIVQRFGKHGFYLNSLFRLKSGFIPVLEESIELGRSFVIKDYQLKPLPLYLLWKGILYFILKHPDYRYLIGPVSISGEFSQFSKYLIISFIREYYFDHELASLVQPRKEYIPQFKTEETDLEVIKKITGEDLKKLDKIIEEIELGNFRLPALLKKYLGQKARIIAFNVDPNFNNALDGLLVMDMFNVPFDTIEALAKELNDKEILKNFPGRKEL